MLTDVERRIAIAELLMQPDPPELRRRGHIRRLDGKPDRYALFQMVSAAYVQAKLLALYERRAEKSVFEKRSAECRVVRSAVRKVVPVAA